MIKALKELGIGGAYLSIIKPSYHKTIANIILNKGKLKTFLLKSGMRQHVHSIHFSYSILCMN
jgi:hypothetical protein